MSDRPEFEKRLDELRANAEARGEITEPGVRAQGGPIPQQPGYYGQAVVRPPVWTWEIPLYFFVGGLAGMAPSIACAAALAHHPEVARAAMWLSGIGALLSPVLLVADLGRPLLFINMLRVFKWRSPMSVGAWILTMFSPCAAGGLLALELHRRGVFTGTVDSVVGIAAALLMAGAAFWGLGLATYTGVLIGVTAVPAWNLHRTVLPIHFGIAGLGSAVGALELLGHHMRPLTAIGFFVGAVETALWIWLEIDRHGAADRALHEGTSGWFLRGSEFLTGPLSLLLRIFAATPFAGASFLLGALLSRFAGMHAGRVSGRDPEAVFAAQSAG
ncbi:MAG: polysulfide reductase NrfD [Verrucomicrobiota bacterium]|nr:polysulfide reductase NrfD [Verrucomicrobiota bacterium]